MPAGTKPLMLIMYADKTKLSTFGTQKGYPWVVALANLDDHVRNGIGLGAATVIGWLPVVRAQEYAVSLLSLIGMIHRLNESRKRKESLAGRILSVLFGTRARSSS